MRKSLTVLAAAGLMASGVAFASPASAAGPECRHYTLGNTVDFTCAHGGQYGEFRASVMCNDGVRQSRWIRMGQWGTMRCQNIRLFAYTYR